MISTPKYSYGEKVLKAIEQGIPYKVAWQVTQECNLRCQHCYASAGKKADTELSLKEAKALVDSLAAIGVNAIVLTGGEPLLREDLFKIIEYSVGRGVIPKVATNGTLVTKDIAKMLKDLGISQVHVSIDGESAEVHDKIRGVSGSFEKTIKGIEYLKNVGLQILVGATLMRSNYEDIPRIIELSADLGATVFTFNDIEPCGRGNNLLPNEDLTPSEREKLYRDIYYKAQELSHKIYVDKFDPTIWLRVIIENTTDEEKKKDIIEFGKALGGCPAGRWVCLISSTGSVRPCAFFPMSGGSVRSTSFEDIWFNSPILKELRDSSKITGSCKKCSYFALCRGCRSRAFHFFGNYFEHDPGCIYSLPTGNKENM